MNKIKYVTLLIALTLIMIGLVSGCHFSKTENGQSAAAETVTTESKQENSDTNEAPSVDDDAEVMIPEESPEPMEPQEDNKEIELEDGEQGSF